MAAKGKARARSGSETDPLQLYLFQSEGTDLYALSLTDCGDLIPSVNGSPPWCLRAEVGASSFVGHCDPAHLAKLVARLEKDGFCLFRASEVSVH